MQRYRTFLTRKASHFSSEIGSPKSCDEKGCKALVDIPGGHLFLPFWLMFFFWKGSFQGWPLSKLVKRVLLCRVIDYKILSSELCENHFFLNRRSITLYSENRYQRACKLTIELKDFA